MKKVRVYDLSKELGLSNKELIQYLLDKGEEIKSHASSIDIDIAQMVRNEFQETKKNKKDEGNKKRDMKPDEPVPSSEVPEKEPDKRPVQVQDKKTDDRTVHVQDKRTDARPVQVQDKRTDARPVQVQDKRTDTRPVQVQDKRTDARPVQVQDKRTDTRPVQVQDKRTDTRPVQVQDKRTDTRPVHVQDKRTDTRPVHVQDKRTDTRLVQDRNAVPVQKLQKQERSVFHPQTRTFPFHKKKDFRGKAYQPEITQKEATVKWMEVPEVVTVAELAKKLEISPNEIIKKLMKQGIMATINQNISFEMSAQIVKSYGYKVEKPKVEKQIQEDEIDSPEMLSPRSPVVTVLGHVDHGKTSLLDQIRKTNVTATESGGITQKIGAYTVEVDGRKIVFIDTPGHEAFTQMRARGARVTDIAVLVIAADDGIMPQTVEAINHARVAKVPIIAALNKIDKPQSNPDRVKKQMAENDLVPEDWGGDVVTVPVSAKTGVGIEDLLEMILLVADLQELKANPHRKANGIIIESEIDKGFGPVATVIIQNGTLNVGDSVVIGNEWGKIRFMMDDKGKRLHKALPSMPVEIVGLSGSPAAGDYLEVVEDDKIARAISEARKEKMRENRMETVQRTSLDDLFKQMKEGETKELNIIIKADVQGSLEALKHSLIKLSTKEVKINVIHGGIGTVNESDIMLATASDAIIIGFNIRPDPAIKRMGEQEHVDIRLYRVIYHMIEDIKKAMTGLLEPEYEEIMTGRAEVRAIFKVSKVGIVAGSYVHEGKINRGANARIIRDGIVVYEGKIESLRRFKDDVKEVSAGFECGIGIEKFGGLQPGDIVETYSLKEIKKAYEDMEGTESANTEPVESKK